MRVHRTQAGRGLILSRYETGLVVGDGSGIGVGQAGRRAEVPVRSRRADRRGQAGQVDLEAGKQEVYRGTDVGLADGWSGTGRVEVPRSRLAGRGRRTTTGDRRTGIGSRRWTTLSGTQAGIGGRGQAGSAAGRQSGYCWKVLQTY